MALRVGGEPAADDRPWFERGGEWTINGQTWASSRRAPRPSLANPALNDVEIWEIQNLSAGGTIRCTSTSSTSRSWDCEFEQKESRAGLTPSVAQGRRLPGRERTVRVITQFGPQAGKYMIHCHNLSHEDHDMIGQFTVGALAPITPAPAQPGPVPEFWSHDDDHSTLEDAATIAVARRHDLTATQLWVSPLRLRGAGGSTWRSRWSTSSTGGSFFLIVTGLFQVAFAAG